MLVYIHVIVVVVVVLLCYYLQFHNVDFHIQFFFYILLNFKQKATLAGVRRFSYKSSLIRNKNKKIVTFYLCCVFLLVTFNILMKNVRKAVAHGRIKSNKLKFKLKKSELIKINKNV